MPLTYRQLLDWDRYARQCGFRDEVQRGMLCAITANLFGGSHRAEEFMPYFDRYAVMPSYEELVDKTKRILHGLKRGHGRQS